MAVGTDAEIFDVSLVICTFNRADMIGTLLQSIEQEAEHSSDCKLQVIIVNNGSTDNTGALCRAWAARQNFHAEIVEEMQPGLGAARNKGLACVKGRIVAMTDDDCTLDKGFLRKLMQCYDQVTTPCVIGGRVELGDTRDLPITILRLSTRSIMGRRFPAGFIIGANMTFSSDCIPLIGPFDPRLGAGAPLRSAEDADWLLLANRKSVPVIYDPSLIVHHFHGRRTVEAARKLHADYAFGNGAMYAKYLFKEPRVLRWLAGSLRRALTDLITPLPDCNLGVKRQRLFRFQHEVRGFFGYWRLARSRMANATP